MKPIASLCLATVLTVVTPSLPLLAAETHPGHVSFGELSPGADGSEFVEVNIRQNLINMVARLAEAQEPEAAKGLRDLHEIRVNVIGLDDSNRDDIASRIASIRQELDDQQWERIVTVRNGSEDVAVFLKMKSEEAVDGIVVTVIDGKKQAVLVNVVGNLRPEKIAQLGERFNIPPLKKLGKLFNHQG